MNSWESIDAWIDRQDWSPAKKDAAHAVHAARAAKNLNPMTGSAWRSWSDAFEEDAS